MSIRMLALELYRAMKDVRELQNKLSGMRSDDPEKEEVEDRLRKANALEARLRNMLDGEKTPRL